MIKGKENLVLGKAIKIQKLLGSRVNFIYSLAPAFLFFAASHWISGSDQIKFELSSNFMPLVIAWYTNLNYIFGFKPHFG